MTAYPTAREIAVHEAHHAAAMCIAPKQVRTDWPGRPRAGAVAIDWGDGPDGDSARAVLIAILLGAMTEGFDGWEAWPIDPDRLPEGARDVRQPLLAFEDAAHTSLS
jgi:hypothetical protein